MDITNVVTILTLVLGSGGISALVTSLLNNRRIKSEALKIENEAESIRRQNNITDMDFVNRKLQEVSDKTYMQSQQLQKDNEKLGAKINELNNKLQLLMEWIMYDNQNYRTWLETKLLELDPDIKIPKCAPPPRVYEPNSYSSSSQQSRPNHSSTNTTNEAQ